MAALTYNQAVSALESALKFGINPSLDPIHAVCEKLGNPQDSYRVVQVAGTNGKSSTTRMIAALLHQQGLHVGLYTSPDLTRYPERMEIDGAVVSDELFAAGISAALDGAKKAGLTITEFEILTAAALWIFAKEGVDWAVLECGLGGRWDATTVSSPEVAVITGIGLEHTAILGDTLEKIAAEKAAIIKPCCKGAVIATGIDPGPQQVIEDRAKECGVPVSHVDLSRSADIAEALEHFPSYQRFNSATALTVTDLALGRRVNKEDADAALRGLQIPGRFETLQTNPLLLIDAAHNPQSAQVTAAEIERRFATRNQTSDQGEGKRPLPALLIGVLADKDVEGVVEAFCPLFDRIVATASASPRSCSPEELAAIVKKATGREPEVAPTIADALDMLSGTDVIATGSITVAGEVKRIWQERQTK